MSDDGGLEPKYEDTSMTILDVVTAWYSANAEPKHIAVKGRSYFDFIRNCYLYLLVHALRRGAPSTGVLIGEEDCKQIVDFLNRAKAIWDRRRLKEEVKAEQRRRTEVLRKAEKHHVAEDVSPRSEEERLWAETVRQTKELIQEAQRRLAEQRRRADETRRAEELRQAEEQRMAEDAIRLDEFRRKEDIFSGHDMLVEHERMRLQSGQCSLADYYAFLLRNRMERSAELLFGSATRPNYSILRNNPWMLDKLKELTFGDNRHPNSYGDPYVSAYYTLRYEAGYAFEYSQVYGLLIDNMLQERESTPFGVISIGSGQGLDYWALRYALAKRGLDWPSVAWRGIDLERWPDHILEDGVAEYLDGTDVRDVLGGMNYLDAKVLMFPKVISEMSGEVIDYISSWLERVTFTRDVHYLCFVHTERRSLDPMDPKHRGAKDCFRNANESFLDPVKSAALINAARNGAGRQSYVSEYVSGTMPTSYYDVAWLDNRTGREWRDTYPYLHYRDSDQCKRHVWELDANFTMDERVRVAVSEIGSACCADFISKDGGSKCDTSRVSCDSSSNCYLTRYPRTMASNIAYQIVRLAKKRSGSAETIYSRYSSASLNDKDIPYGF